MWTENHCLVSFVLNLLVDLFLYITVRFQGVSDLFKSEVLVLKDCTNSGNEFGFDIVKHLFGN